jgi:hypothetical protein
MKTDGYIFTPELLQWRYFHRPVVVQVLIHVLLSSAHNEASAATLSYRDLALQLHTTVKTIRVAIDVLIAEKIITKCSAPRASTKLYVNSSHPLSHCIIPWQRDQGAQVTAHFGAQIGAQYRAQIQSSEVPLNKGDSEDSETIKGTVKGTIKGKDGARSRAHPKQGTHQKAHYRAQINNPETPLNKGYSEDSAEVEGTAKGNGKGTEVRGKKQIKENISPEPPIKENKQRKEKAHTHTQKKEKEKKSLDPEVQFSEVLRLFNRLFLGTQVKPISKMTPDRKKMVAKFISDYSFEDIEPMLRKALNSDLLSGRKDGGCYISFNWLFNPKNYEALMEGTFDNPTVVASAGKKPQHSSSPPPSPPQPQCEETNEEIEARLRMKEDRKKELEKEQTEALRQKYLGWIEAAKKNPNGSMAKMVIDAYKNGTLAKLGIVWNPSVAEEEQSLADLDDQTQNYLQSLLSD